MNSTLPKVLATYKEVAALLPQKTQQLIQKRLAGWQREKQAAAISTPADVPQLVTRSGGSPRPLSRRYFTLERP